MRALRIKPLSNALKFYLLVMIMTPTFYVYYEDLFAATAKEDIIIEFVAFLTLLFVTIIFSIFLEDYNQVIFAIIGFCVNIGNMLITIFLYKSGFN